MATKIIKEEVIRVRVDKELKENLKLMIKDKNMNMSEYITYLLEYEINKYEFKIDNKDKVEKRVNKTELKIIDLRDKLINKPKK